MTTEEIIQRHEAALVRIVAFKEEGEMWDAISQMDLDPTERSSVISKANLADNRKYVWENRESEIMEELLSLATTDDAALGYCEAFFAPTVEDDTSATV